MPFSGLRYSADEIHGDDFPWSGYDRGVHMACRRLLIGLVSPVVLAFVDVSGSIVEQAGPIILLDEPDFGLCYTQLIGG